MNSYDIVSEALKKKESFGKKYIRGAKRQVKGLAKAASATPGWNVKKNKQMLTNLKKSQRPAWEG